MTNECPEWPEVEVPVESIRCRRIERWLPLAEHARCPYCFGREAAVASGVHARFCDFVPGRDPVSFGFPAEAERDLRG